MISLIAYYRSSTDLFDEGIVGKINKRAVLEITRDLVLDPSNLLE